MSPQKISFGYIWWLRCGETLFARIWTHCGSVCLSIKFCTIRIRMYTNWTILYRRVCDMMISYWTRTYPMIFGLMYYCSRILDMMNFRWFWCSYLTDSSRGISNWMRTYLTGIDLMICNLTGIDLMISNVRNLYYLYMKWTDRICRYLIHTNMKYSDMKYSNMNYTDMNTCSFLKWCMWIYRYYMNISLVVIYCQ